MQYSLAKRTNIAPNNLQYAFKFEEGSRSLDSGKDQVIIVLFIFLSFFLE